MHRSGTSILSALTTCFDTSIGENVMKALPENPRGFWENQAVADLNDQVLKSMGGRWDLPNIESWAECKEFVLAEYLEQVKQLIAAEFRDAERITIKDPRMAFTLPLWTRALEELGYHIKVLHIVRNPDEVFQSIHHRNGFSREHSDLLWLESVLGILGHGLNQLLLIQHNYLYEHRRDTVYAVANYIGFDETQVDSVLEDFETHHFDNELRHFSSDDRSSIRHTEACTVFDVLSRYQGVVSLDSSDITNLHTRVRAVYPEHSAIKRKLKIYLDPLSSQYTENSPNWVSSALIDIHEKAHATPDHLESQNNDALLKKLQQVEQVSGQQLAEIERLHAELEELSLERMSDSKQFEKRMLRRIKSIDQLANVNNQLRSEKHALVANNTDLQAQLCELETQKTKALETHQSILKEAGNFDTSFRILHAKLWSTNRWRVGSGAAHAWQKITRRTQDCQAKQVIEYTESCFHNWVESLTELANADDSQSKNTETHIHDTQTAKEEHAKRAIEKLDTFLSSERTLDFTYSTTRADVSIILVLFNRAELTLLCLESILNRIDNLSVQLIIIDNASSDRTGELLDRITGAEIHRNKENLGFLLASNQGLKRCNANQTLFLNNDALASPSAISRAYHLLNSRTELGAICARIIAIDGKLQEAGCICWSDGSTFGYGRGEDPESFKFLFERYVDYGSGAFLQVRTDLLKELNGFDTRYEPAYYEDADLCISLNLLGHKVLYSPEVEVYHYEFGSSEASDYAVELCETNKKKFLSKHGIHLKHHFPPHQNLHLARVSPSWKRPKLLYIDDRTPHVYFGSGFPRSNFIINTLADFEIEVAMLPLNFPFEETADSVYTDIDRRVELLAGIGRTGFAEFWQEYANSFDLVWVSRPHNMEYLRPILSGGDHKLIYDAEAIFTDRHIAMHELGLVECDKSHYELVRDELSPSQNANLIVAVSEHDKSTISRALENKTPVVCCGYGLQVKPASGFANRDGFLFIGNLDYSESPNSDSLLWFIETAWPLIKKKLPKARLDVVGSNSAPLIETLEAHDVIFHGMVDNLDRFYQSSRVFIAPTRYAAGLPLKVQEAAANGIPCVVTDILKTQLQWQHNKEVLSAATNDFRTFSQHCIQLYTEESTWTNIQSEAQKAILNDCSQDTFKSNLQAALANLLSQHK